jgi:protein ImuB
MRRVAAVFLGKLRVEIVGEKESLPLAVVVSRPGGAVQTERDVLGNTRIDVASAEARAFGVRSGQTVSAARAKCAHLRVKVVGSQAVHAALVRIAESLLAFGPAVSFDAVKDMIWVEVGGCAHLHGGEEALAQAVRARVGEQGHACSVAIANGPRIAAAVARYWTRKMVSVVPEGEGARAMRVLPVAALGFEDDVMGWLSGLGLRTCGDLQKLPRRALGTRLGARAHDVMQLLDGEDRAPLEAHRPAEVPEEQVDLEWGAPTIESLVFVLTTLCERLSARLEGRAMGAGRVELVLGLDRALVSGTRHAGKDGPPVSRVEVVLPAPIRGAKELFAVVRVRLDRHSIAAPVLSVTLRAHDLAPMTGMTRDLLSPEPKAERMLMPLVAELSAELGPERVGTLSLVDTWVPDERSVLSSRFLTPRFAGAKRSGGGSGAAPPHTPQRERVLVTSGLEPTRLVPPARVPRDSIEEVEILARVEGVAWWRRDVQRRDLAAGWLEGALAWLQVGVEDIQLRGWVD